MPELFLDTQKDIAPFFSLPGDNSDSPSARLFADCSSDRGEASAYKSSDKSIQQAGDNLLASARAHIRNPDELKHFEQDLRAFEKRAAEMQISPTEVVSTLRQVGRLFGNEGKSALSPALRRELAEQVLHHAADPTAIDQGKYNTCNITTIEARTFTRCPASAAKLIADVALDGAYVSPGTGLRVAYTGSLADSRRPHGEAKNHPPIDGQRSFASQIFQVTGVNLYYQQVKKDNHDPGVIQYEQHDGDAANANDNGERLKAYPAGGPARIVGYGPAIGVDEMTKIMSEITAKSESGYVLEFKAPINSKEVTVIDSPAKLDQTLSRMKNNKQLPAIIEIASSDAIFSPTGSGGKHVVCVSDYDPASKSVSVDNQWGCKDDYLGPRSLRMTDIYHAMVGLDDQPADVAARVASDRRQVMQNRAAGRTDCAVEVEYVRDKMVAGQYRHDHIAVLETDFDAALAHAGAKWEKQIAVGKLDDRECRVAVKSMAYVLGALSADQIAQIKRQPYWKNVSIVLHRFPDEIAASVLDDAHKAWISH